MGFLRNSDSCVGGFVVVGTLTTLCLAEEEGSRGLRRTRRLSRRNVACLQIKGLEGHLEIKSGLSIEEGQEEPKAAIFARRQSGDERIETQEKKKKRRRRRTLNQGRFN